MPKNQRNPIYIQSRSNDLVKKLRKLAHEPAAYRKHGLVWVEGEHLCQAACAHQLQPVYAVFAHRVWQAQVAPELYKLAEKVVVLDDAVFADISPLPSAGNMGYLLDAKQCMGQVEQIHPHANTVVLDCIQDAGNVGSILRTAAAMNFKQIIAIQGTAALWSPKVLRSAMGAHFGLQLFESATPMQLQQLRIPLLVTHLQADALLHNATLPTPCAWVLGHEGQGVQDDVLALAHQRLRIAQIGGEESLNVAAAAAICLHASSVQVQKSKKKSL